MPGPNGPPKPRCEFGPRRHDIGFHIRVNPKPYNSKIPYAVPCNFGLLFAASHADKHVPTMHVQTPQPDGDLGILEQVS